MADMSGRPATMIDVARRAGVSLKTVSRVLNNEPFVSEGTRVQVVAAAEALNYRFNHAARSLRAASAQVIVLAVDHPDRSSYLESVHLGAFKECQRQNVQLFLDIWHDGANDCARVLDEQSPIGVILAPPLCDEPTVLDVLRERATPHVLISPSLDEAAPLTVSMDDEAAARDATRLLIRLGHRSIGFIRGNPDHGATHKRHAGYVAALAEAGLPLDERLVRQGQFTYPTGLECAEALLDLSERPTAIFASNDDMAAAVLTAAYRRHIEVPDELSVVGFDDTLIAGIVTPNLTTVRQPIEAMAEAAVRLLAQHVAARGDQPGHVRLDYHIVRRGSATEPPPAA